MLGKLIKYDMKDTYKLGMLMSLAAMLMTITMLVFTYLPFWDAIGVKGEACWEFYALIIGGVCLFLLDVFVISATQYGVIALNGYSFYNSLFSSRGYLTNTLPTTPFKLLLSKLIVGSIWSVLITVLNMVGMTLVIFSAIFRVFSVLYDDLELAGFLSMMFEDLPVGGSKGVSFLMSILFIVVIIGLTFISAVIAAIAGVSVLYGSLAIGQLFRHHKLIMGVVSYFVITFVQGSIISVISSLLTIVASFASPAIGQITSYLASFLASAVFGAILFFITKYIMENKLNLE